MFHLCLVEVRLTLVVSHGVTLRRDRGASREIVSVDKLEKADKLSKYLELVNAKCQSVKEIEVTDVEEEWVKFRNAVKDSAGRYVE